MTDGHLDTEVLAAYEEGLLTSSRAVQVEEHLAECPTCSATLEQLDLVRTRLSKAPRIASDSGRRRRPDRSGARCRTSSAGRARCASRGPRPSIPSAASCHDCSRQRPQLRQSHSVVTSSPPRGVATNRLAPPPTPRVVAAEAADADESGEDVTPDDQRAESAPEETSMASGRAARTALAAEIQAIARFGSRNRTLLARCWPATAGRRWRANSTPS